MSRQNNSYLIKVAALGAISGMRSMSGLALLVRHASRNPNRFTGTPAEVLLSDTAQGFVPLMAAGEMLADKLPILPDRIALLPLMGRAFWGGVVGALFSTTRRASPTLGAGIGSLSAVLFAFISFHARMSMNEKLKLPSPVAGLVEDIFILTAGPRIMESPE